MKKIVLSLIVALSIVSCKKMENTENQNPTISADSAAANVESNDSTVALVKKEVTSKILELEEEKKMLDEKFKTEIDSSAKELIVTEIKNTQKKIDSAKDKVVSTIEKIKIPERIVKETKVIYKDAPKPKVMAEPAKSVVKTGILEILVDDMELAKEVTKEQIRKYDGTIKTEQISMGNDQKMDFLKIRLPYEKSDYLIEDLERNVGKIDYKNIQITGDQYSKNAFCDLEITLYAKNSKLAATSATPESFGGRMASAISSGWNVIEEIFFFFLPFWPLFLIAGGVYYFIKKKEKNPENQNG